jgi:hypothetical protein
VEDNLTQDDYHIWTSRLGCNMLFKLRGENVTVVLLNPEVATAMTYALRVLEYKANYYLSIGYYPGYLHPLKQFLENEGFIVEHVDVINHARFSERKDPQDPEDVVY